MAYFSDNIWYFTWIWSWANIAKTFEVARCALFFGFLTFLDAIFYFLKIILLFLTLWEMNQKRYILKYKISLMVNNSTVPIIFKYLISHVSSNRVKGWPAEALSGNCTFYSSVKKTYKSVTETWLQSFRTNGGFSIQRYKDRKFVSW